MDSYEYNSFSELFPRLNDGYYAYFHCTTQVTVTVLKNLLCPLMLNRLS